MDSSGSPSRPVTRGVKRAANDKKKAEEEKKKRWRNEKRTMKGFLEPRLTESAINPGTQVNLIGRNYMLVDPKNPQKILIPDDTQVKVEVKTEQATGDVEMEEEPSTYAFQDQDEDMLEDEFGGSNRPTGADTTEVTENEGETKTEMENVAPNQVSVKDEVGEENEFGDSDQLGAEHGCGEVHCGVGSNLEWSEIVIHTVRSELPEDIPQKECTRCRDLEKRLKETEQIMEELKEEVKRTKEEAGKKTQADTTRDEEKNLRIREAELELETLKQSNTQEMSEMVVDKDSKLAAEKKKIFDTDRSNNYDTEDENKWRCFIRSISSEESKEEEDIDTLVLKASEYWKDESGDTILHYFAMDGNLKAVKHIFSIEGFKGDVNAKNRAGSTPIMKAARAKRNFAAIANVLVAKGADLNATNVVGENALFIALTGSQIPLTEIEIVFGTLTSSIFSLTDEDNDTVLHREARRGNLKALEYYMSLKPDLDVVNARNAYGRTPMMESLLAPLNFSPIVDLLLRNGANFEPDSSGGGIIRVALHFKRPLTYIKKLVDVGAPWDKNSVLRNCIAVGHVEALQYFIMKSAEVNTLSNEQRLVMTNGTYEDLKRTFGDKPDRGIFSLEILEELSKHGVTWDDCMLHECAEKENWEAVRYCILKGADVNSKDSVGKTPLMRAVTTNQVNPEIVDFLVAKGANVNEKDEYGFSILHHAIETDSENISLAIVKKLVEHGATWSTGVVGSGARKESILHAAVRGWDTKVVKYFISKGVDVKARDNNGDTPFLLAVRERPWCHDLREALVNGGADPNDRDKDGNSALLILVGKYPRFRQAVKLLIDLGCDWRVPNNHGLTVLGVLEKDGDSEFLKYFKSLITQRLRLIELQGKYGY